VLGALAAGYFFAASIGNLASMPVCHLLRQRYAVVLSLARIGLGVVLFALALQSSIFLFAGLYILLYFLLGTEESPGATLFNHQVPSQYRSTLMSFNSLMLQVGVLGGSIVMGYLASSISISFAWQVAAVALLVSALPYLFLVRRTKAVDAK
jgi:MFS family permease